MGKVLTLQLLFPLLLFVEGGVERAGAVREIHPANERARFLRAVLAVHAAVLPLDTERALIVHVVERDDDIFELDVAVAQRAEVPEPARVAEVHVAAKDAHRAVAVAPPHVLHVAVGNPVAKATDKLHVVNALIAEVARVVVEAKRRMAADHFDGALGAGDVERDLGRVDLQRELDAELLVFVEDRLPSRGEILEALVNPRLRHGREAVEVRPDAGAGEAVDDLHAEILGALRGADHFLRSAFADAVGFAVAPHMGGEDGLVPLVNLVANGLSDEVAGNGPDIQAVLGENLVAHVAVVLVFGGLHYVEVVAPTGEFETIKAEVFRFLAYEVEGQIGPLTSAKRHRTPNFRFVVHRTLLCILGRSSGWVFSNSVLKSNILLKINTRF